MTWYVREVSDLERLDYSRLAELYALLRRWRDAVPELAWRPMPELEARIADPKSTVEQVLGAETAAELLRRLRIQLRALLDEWETTLAEIARTRPPVLSRVLRLAEEEALRYSSAEWKDRSDERFPSLGPVFAAYRETPLYCLYRDELVIIRQTTRELLFFTRHPLLELEAAWMRGFVSALRPSVQVQPFRMGDRPAFAWREISA
jgi:hypothetical protein